MKIKAIATIIEFDNGQMVVINAGEEGELSEARALQKIAAGVAEDAEPKAEATAAAEPSDNDELKTARARYGEVLGKKAFPGWSLEQLNEKIAQAEATAAAEAQAQLDAAAAQDGEGSGDDQTGEGEGEGDDAPPAGDSEGGETE
jgi:hypothetical protein